MTIAARTLGQTLPKSDQFVSIRVIDVTEGQERSLGGPEDELLGLVADHGDDRVGLVHESSLGLEESLGDAPWKVASRERQSLALYLVGENRKCKLLAFSSQLEVTRNPSRLISEKNP